MQLLNYVAISSFHRQSQLSFAQGSTVMFMVVNLVSR